MKKLKKKLFLSVKKFFEGGEKRKKKIRRGRLVQSAGK